MEVTNLQDRLLQKNFEDKSFLLGFDKKQKGQLKGENDCFDHATESLESQQVLEEYLASDDYQTAKQDWATLKRKEYLQNYYQENKEKYYRKGDRHKLDRQTRYRLNILQGLGYQLLSGQKQPYIPLSYKSRTYFFLCPPQTDPQRGYLLAHLFWREKSRLEELWAKSPRCFKELVQDLEVEAAELSKWNDNKLLVAAYLDQDGRVRPQAQALGYNEPTYRTPHNRSLACLAMTNGAVLAKVDGHSPLLDLDPNKKDAQGQYKLDNESLRQAFTEGGGKFQVLINALQVPYYWRTATPGNVLIPLPVDLSSEMPGGKLYHQDTGLVIGDLLGKDKLVALPVGSNENRRLVITKWGREQLEEQGSISLNKKKIKGSAKPAVEQILQRVFLTLDKPELKVKKVVRAEKLMVSLVDSPIVDLVDPSLLAEESGVRNTSLQAFILGHEHLPSDNIDFQHLWKIFYRNQHNQVGFFVLNNHHRRNMLDQLGVNSGLKNIVLHRGKKYQFFSRMGFPWN